MQDRSAVGLGEIRIDGKELVPLAPENPVGIVAKFLEEALGVATPAGQRAAGGRLGLDDHAPGRSRLATEPALIGLVPQVVDV
jgi:hypothetical protein